MTSATLVVVGTTEIVLAIVGTLLVLGVPVITLIMVWKLIRPEQSRNRE